MSLRFREQYINSFSFERTSLTNTMEHFYPTFMPVSKEACETFFFVQAIRHCVVSYPYSYEIKNLDSYYILYTVAGNGQLNYNNNKYKLIPNSFVFICCNDYYRIEAKSPNWNFYGIYVNGGKTSEYYRLYSKNDFVLCPSSKVSNIYNILIKLFNHQQSKTNQTELINSKIITDLLTEILINKAYHHEQINRIPDYILGVKHLFDNSYSENFTLDALSKNFRISKYKLARDFTYYISESPINYLIRKRITVAKDMLWQTNKTVSEISKSVGIENISYFIRIFKKYTGMTPVMFRRQKAGNIVYYTNN